ncbi:hypothetical protein J4429_01355 [Candidatus Pacearchaeota archaeon]|nr:hypothetical protein [Candidatus Pacearchaeota archaeon]
MIYRGYAIFRRMGGRILEVPDSNPHYHGSIERIGERNFISLALQDHIDNQIETLVHELLHLGYEYRTPQYKIIPGLPIPKELGITIEEAKKYIGDMEKLIEAETEKVSQTQPLLVSHLRELIINSNKHTKL